MSKQGDIREGIDKLIYQRIMAFLSFDEWDKDYHPKTLLCEKLTTELLSYLHSQGVVIRVDRDLPAEGRGSVEDWSYEYVAVEPLIKEGE